MLKVLEGKNCICLCTVWSAHLHFLGLQKLMHSCHQYYSHKQRSNLALSKGLISLEDHQYLNSVMDVRTGAVSKNPALQRKNSIQPKYCRSFSQGHVKNMCLLSCLTASLLILPLILPPLPPPPFLLLLIPIGILGLLMFLAFMPSNVRDATTYAYA